MINETYLDTRPEKQLSALFSLNVAFRNSQIQTNYWNDFRKDPELGQRFEALVEKIRVFIKELNKIEPQTGEFHVIELDPGFYQRMGASASVQRQKFFFVNSVFELEKNENGVEHVVLKTKKNPLVYPIEDEWISKEVVFNRMLMKVSNSLFLMANRVYAFHPIKYFQEHSEDPNNVNVLISIRPEMYVTLTEETLKNTILKYGNGFSLPYSFKEAIDVLNEITLDANVLEDLSFGFKEIPSNEPEYMRLFRIESLRKNLELLEFFKSGNKTNKNEMGGFEAVLANDSLNEDRKLPYRWLLD